jgi:hypothetical protein
MEGLGQLKHPHKVNKMEESFGVNSSFEVSTRRRHFPIFILAFVMQVEQGKFRA